MRLISGFRREVDEDCVFLRYYTACSGNTFPTFRDNPSVPFSRAKIIFGFCKERRLITNRNDLR